MNPRRTLLTFVAAAPLLSLLAACETPPPRPSLARIGFGHRAPLRFAVARVAYRDETRAVQDPSQVAHRFPDPPAQVVERWARERLQAVGDSGELEVVLREASVTETALPRTSGLRGLVTVDQSERYDGRVLLSLRARDAEGLSLGGLEVQVEQATSIGENVGPLERQGVWHRLAETLARRLDEEVERGVRAGDLARLLR